MPRQLSAARPKQGVELRRQWDQVEPSHVKEAVDALQRKVFSLTRSLKLFHMS